MDPHTSATHYIDHVFIANVTGLKLGKIRKLASSIGDLLNPYRIQGDKGVYLYNADGLKIWEFIAQYIRRGQTPKTIRANLESMLEKPESSKSSAAGQTHAKPQSDNSVFAPKNPFQERALDESLVRSLISQQEKMLMELKDSHKRETEAKDQTIEILKNQNAMLMAPREGKKTNRWTRIFK